MTTNPMQHYILKNERNLRIAAAVGEAWPEARETLVSAFHARLESRLTKNLKGWKVEHTEAYFSDRYGTFYLNKPAWDNQYYISLQYSNHGEKMIFGVIRSEWYIKKRKFSPELLTAVRQIYPSAHSRTWWEAVIDMQSPAADWRKPEVLWRMYKDHKFLVEVSEQLLEVARVGTPIIDRLARKK